MNHLPRLAIGLLLAAAATAGEAVVAERVPGGGVQPQIAIDADGTVHAVWLAGPAGAANVMYARRKADAAAFGPAIRVNSQDGAAIALGTIRGAQLALGKGGRPHVLWNGSATSQPRGPDGGPGMLYARLADDGAAFEPQRQLIARAGGIDGGGSIVADGQGGVWAFWHALGGAKDESGRAVAVARSSDDGATFAADAPATTLPTGACGCCGMRAGIDGRGRLYVVYRGAAKGQRDEILLTLASGQKAFTGQVLDPWASSTCPMSTVAMTGAGERMVLAWETKARIRFAVATAGKPGAPVDVAATKEAKHPTVAVNQRGELLVAWAEGTGWERGGELAWQRYDAKGAPLGPPGRAAGLPAWSLPSAVARPDGSFLVLY